MQTRATYYVYGSGLVPIPHERVNEISTLKAEYHADEARKAWMLAWARKIA
jgi:hypothetical protein